MELNCWEDSLPPTSQPESEGDAVAVGQAELTCLLHITATDGFWFPTNLLPPMTDCRTESFSKQYSGEL